MPVSPEDSIVAQALEVKHELEKDVVPLRRRLEIRTWLLGLSLTLNVGLIAGIAAKLIW